MPCNLSSSDTFSVSRGYAPIIRVKTEAELKTPKQEEVPEELPKEPEPTLAQRLGVRNYHLTKKTLSGVEMLILVFPGVANGPRLTLLMPAANPFPPNLYKEAQLDVHRKFLTSYGKFLHWISFGFPGLEGSVQAQIMLPTRLEAAVDMIKKGSSACFLDCPNRLKRRGQCTKRVVKSARN